MKNIDPIIEFEGEILAKIGYGILSREFLKPIVDKVKIIPKEDYLSSDQKYNSGFWMDQVIESIIKPEANIRLQFCIPPLYKYNPNKFNIGMCIWDTDKFPLEWLPLMQNMDAMIFPTQDLTNIAVKCGIKKPCLSFEHHFDTSRWKNISPINIDGTKNIKYIMEEEWSPTSNIEEVIHGFCIAFEGSKEVSLTLKIVGITDVNQRKNIRNEISGMINKLKGLAKPTILVIDDNFTEQESSAIIASHNYFISLRGSSKIDIEGIRNNTLGIPTIGSEIPNRQLNTLFKVASFAIPCMNPNPYYKYNQFYFKPDIRHYIGNLIQSYNLIKNDPKKYKEISTTIKDTAKIYEKTNLLEVCTYMKTKYGTKTS